MHGVAIALLAEDKERLSVLQHRLDGTQMGRNVFSQQGFPTSATDPILRQIQDVRAEVVLQEAHGGVLLVDFSPLGHAALHLNARPSFGLRDTLQNLHRMDASLLEGFMTQCKGGLQLLAGSQSPQALTPAAAELARLFDLLVAHFRYVVVDCSNRVDQTARLLCDLSSSAVLVAQADVVSWCCAYWTRILME